MSLMKGGLSGARFLVVGSMPDEDGLWSRLQEALQAKAFTEPVGIQRSEQRSGWCLPDNLFDTDFGLQHRWKFNQYALLSLRVDRKVLVAKRVKAMLDKRIRAWCEEHSRERAPSSVRTEIKELLEDELYATTQPRTVTIDIVWNLAEGWVFCGSTSEAAKELLRKTFRDTFGLALVPARPLDCVSDCPSVLETLEISSPLDLKTGPNQVSLPGSHRGGPDLSAEDRDTLARSGSDAPVGDAERPSLPHIAGDFYAWLWWMSEREEGRLDLGADCGTVDVWVSSRVAFRQAEGRARATVSGDNAGAMSEALAALASGKRISEIAIGLRREGREYDGTLKGPNMELAGVKLPAECRSGGDEVLYERMFLYEDFHHVLRMLFRRFASERASAAWVAEGASALRIWVAASLTSAQRSGDSDELDAAPARGGRLNGAGWLSAAQSSASDELDEGQGEGEEGGEVFTVADLKKLAAQATELAHSDGLSPSLVDRCESIARSLGSMAQSPPYRGAPLVLTLAQEVSIRNWRGFLATLEDAGNDATASRSEYGQHAIC